MFEVDSGHYEAKVIAGSGKAGNKDGTPEECSFYSLGGIAVHEKSHSCFVVDVYGNAIRRIAFK
jgi:hypothetical protein